MRALIFAAGLGTRLRPLTDHLPKALVSVGKKTLLEHTLLTLKAAGATEIVINVHHFAQQIQDFIATHDFDLPIRISDESTGLLDTGGGLRQAMPLFSPGNAPILIHNVDIFSNAPLAEFYAASYTNDITLLVSDRKTQRYLLFDDHLQMLGWTNISTGEVRTPYTNLNPSKCHKLAFAGIHAVSPKIKKQLNAYPTCFPIIQFYIENCHQLHIQAVLKNDLCLLDVGKQDSLKAADTWLSNTFFDNYNYQKQESTT